MADRKTVESDEPDVLYPDVEVKLVGTDGNAFSLMGRVSRALKEGGHRDAVAPFQKEAMKGDYDHLLQTCMKYVVVS